MKKAVYVFGGQGAQQEGMATELYAQHQEVRDVFSLADRILKRDISKIVLKGSAEELRQTINSQPAIFLVNHSYFIIASRELPCVASAGYSLGQYNALVAVRALSIQNAIKAVGRRAELMQNCIPDEPIQEGTSHMAAITGYDLRGIADICGGISRQGHIVGIASKNSKDQTVISGNNAAVVEAVNSLRERSAKASYLNVSGPFHCSLMDKASEGMASVLEGIVINKPDFPIALNVSGEICYYNPFEIRQDLEYQPSSTVEWDASLRAIIKANYPNFVACGVGNVQKNFLIRLKREKEFRHINIFKLEDYLK
jgi:[acyl-carrier-protein] S-malonyltransferase